MRGAAAIIAVACAACSFDGHGTPAIDGQPPTDDAGSNGTDAALGSGSDAGPGSDATTTCTPGAIPHDEDADGVDDACDPCPQIKNENPTDTDHDLVPDVCDPHPNIAGDHLIAFFGFNTAAGDLAALGWKATAGALTDWTLANDDLAITAGNATRIIIVNVSMANVAVDVGFDVGTATATDRHQCYFDALMNVKADATEYVAGGFYYDSGGNGREIFDFDVTESSNNGFVPLAESSASPPSAGNAYRMGLVSSPTDVHYESSSSATKIALTALDPRRPNQHIGLRTKNAKTAVHYVAVYGF